jgi:hypothetical protein
VQFQITIAFVTQLESPRDHVVIFDRYTEDNLKRKEVKYMKKVTALFLACAFALSFGVAAAEEHMMSAPDKKEDMAPSMQKKEPAPMKKKKTGTKKKMKNEGMKKEEMRKEKTEPMAPAGK